MLAHDQFDYLKEGMDVYDCEGSHAGTIKVFRRGEGKAHTSKVGKLTVSEIIQDELGDSNTLPSAMYNRMFSEGFICIERSFFRSDLVIMPHQIYRYGGQAIYLHVHEDDLVSI